MLAALFVALTSLSLMTGPNAYPITPVPLRTLMERASLIVVLDGNAPEVTRENSGSMSVRRLKVLSTLKGEGGRETVDVRLRNLICPAPARYSADTRLAFLEPVDDAAAGLYSTVGLSYGAKAISPEDLPGYVARIEEFVDLSSMPASAAYDRALGDWQLRCLADDATRGEALLDLSQQASLARRENEDDQLPQLDPSQEVLLVELFVKDVFVCTGDGRFADLLDDIDCQDDRWELALVVKLADSAVKLDTSQGQECARYAVSILARRLGDVKLKAWEKEFRSQRASREGTPRARELLADYARRAKHLLAER